MSHTSALANILGVAPPPKTTALCCKLEHPHLYKCRVQSLAEANEHLMALECYLHVGNDWYVVIHRALGGTVWHLKFPHDHDHTRLNNQSFSWAVFDVAIPDWVNTTPLRTRNW